MADDGGALAVEEAARALDRARQAHERAPDDERKYQALLEAQINWHKADARRIQRELDGEKAGSRALRRALETAKGHVERLRVLQVDTMRAAMKAAKPKRGGKQKALPMLDLISQAKE